MLVHLAHGAGNDFVVIEDRDGTLDVSDDLIRALCDRHSGLGGDGLIRLAPSLGTADVFMDYRNADGSMAEMCGNGIRVTARLAHDLGWIDVQDGAEVRVDTRAGTKSVLVGIDDGVITSAAVDMGPDNPDPAASGFSEPLSGDPHLLDIDRLRIPVGLTSMGNPHVVLVVEDVDNAPVHTLGPRIETDPRWEHGVNVGFLQVTSRSTARLRVWERGVGETQACGSGTCAAFAVAHRQGLVDDDVMFDVPGGTLVVTRQRGGSLVLAGPVAVIGSVELDPHWVIPTGAA